MATTHISATEKRLSTQKIGSIDYEVEDKTGRPRNESERPSSVTKLGAINRLKELDFDKVTIRDLKGNKMKVPRKTLWQFMQMIKNDDLEVFTEVIVSDFRKKYKLDFGSKVLTYIIEPGKRL